MEDSGPKGMKVPRIVIGVAALVILAGILVRTLKSPSPAPTPEQEPAPAVMPEPAPIPALPPEPTQQVRYSSLTATDGNGDTWTLGLAGVPPRLSEDGSKPGAPLIVKADVESFGQSVSLGVIIAGQAGEVYEPGAAKNGRRMPAPTFKVLDESGAELGSGSFEYG